MLSNREYVLTLAIDTSTSSTLTARLQGAEMSLTYLEVKMERMIELKKTCTGTFERLRDQTLSFSHFTYSATHQPISILPSTYVMSSASSIVTDSSSSEAHTLQ